MMFTSLAAAASGPQAAFPRRICRRAGLARSRLQLAHCAGFFSRSDRHDPRRRRAQRSFPRSRCTCSRRQRSASPFSIALIRRLCARQGLSFHNGQWHSSRPRGHSISASVRAGLVLSSSVFAVDHIGCRRKCPQISSRSVLHTQGSAEAQAPLLVQRRCRPNGLVPGRKLQRPAAARFDRVTASASIRMR